MPQQQPLSYGQVHRSLVGLFDGDMHGKRVKSLANATLGVVTNGSLAVSTIGHGLALARGLTTKHAIKQVDRLLSNEGIDIDAALRHWVPRFLGEQSKPRGHQIRSVYYGWLRRCSNVIVEREHLLSSYFGVSPAGARRNSRGGRSYSAWNIALNRRTLPKPDASATSAGGICVCGVTGSAGSPGLGAACGNRADAQSLSPRATSISYVELQRSPVSASHSVGPPGRDRRPAL